MANDDNVIKGSDKICIEKHYKFIYSLAKFAISVLYYNKKVFVWKRFKIEPLRKCQNLYWKNILFRRQKLLKLDIINESHAFSKIERLRGLE